MSSVEEREEAAQARLHKINACVNTRNELKRFISIMTEGAPKGLAILGQGKRTLDLPFCIRDDVFEEFSRISVETAENKLVGLLVTLESMTGLEQCETSSGDIPSSDGRKFTNIECALLELLYHNPKLGMDVIKYDLPFDSVKVESAIDALEYKGYIKRDSEMGISITRKGGEAWQGFQAVKEGS